MSSLKEMMRRHAQPGVVTWIGLRPARRAAMVSVSRVSAGSAGLVGDHGRSETRGLTLIQAEHFPAVEAILGRQVTPELVRRNIVVRGINLVALRKMEITVGAVRLEVTAPCHPCSRMEEVLGHGGYSAMRGHGGMYARVISGGIIRVGDPVLAAETAHSSNDDL